ncbi:hypothetical protein HS088_TW20G00233 [Tripterygium wilfordii]|uniref:Uncharacterized protein n=1 Tax=Tripterygium wilfordii TaxID=458696 RepID=A0A7J7C6W2_TRIWF|nr:hypothetical protein HS088_TW20G00233 [Tripterygium wilfordii]
MFTTQTRRTSDTVLVAERAHKTSKTSSNPPPNTSILPNPKNPRIVRTRFQNTHDPRYQSQRGILSVLGQSVIRNPFSRLWRSYPRVILQGMWWRLFSTLVGVPRHSRVGSTWFSKFRTGLRLWLDSRSTERW